jgi:tRNA-dihydrouridine synthase B
MRLVLVLALAVAQAFGAAPAARAQPGEQPYLSGPVSFRSEDLEIRAVLAKPQTAGKRPAFIYTHDQMSPELAKRRPALTRLDPGSHLDALAREGWVVLFVARRGHWGSDGTTTTYATQGGGQAAQAADLYRAVEAEAADLVAAVEYLRGASFVDRERIAIGGIGTGGLAALLAAAREPAVRAVVSLAGALNAGAASDGATVLEAAWRGLARERTRADPLGGERPRGARSGPGAGAAARAGGAARPVHPVPRLQGQWPPDLLRPRRVRALHAGPAGVPERERQGPGAALAAMQIGSVAIDAPARLAPMAGITNAPFRLIARECGSGLTTTEEMDAAALLMRNPHADELAAYYPEERPLAMQLLGRDQETLVRAAERLQALGADIVDLNMGCPMPKITAKGKGAALMKDVARTALILRAMRKSVSVPFTIKIRGGWDDEHLNAVEVAQMAEAEGVDGITVHPRTRAQRFTGRAPWDIIRDVVRAVSIHVTGNGDVRSMAEARRMMAETGCRSVMIGRGALGRPWIFDEGFDALPAGAQRGHRLRVITRHCALIRQHCREGPALVQTKKHLAWYAEGLDHATRCRAEIFQARTPDEAWTVFRRYWDARPGPVTADAVATA